jgi:hypothetical protein
MTSGVNQMVGGRAMNNFLNLGNSVARSDLKIMILRDFDDMISMD